MQDANIIAYLLLFIIVIVGVVINANNRKKLEDPTNNEVVYLDQLYSIHSLTDTDQYILSVFRQSGNLQQDQKVFRNPNEAIKAAVLTLKRAKIEYVIVSHNDSQQFSFRRPFHDHRGRNEGKKVGSVTISKV
jgi:hypothetical protein